jgi:hypothetical protein
MKRGLCTVSATLALFVLVCSGCSGEKEETLEKSSVEEFAGQVGREAAEGIKKPINKAQDINRRAQEHVITVDNLDKQKEE